MIDDRGHLLQLGLAGSCGWAMRGYCAKHYQMDGRGWHVVDLGLV
jgi:hypothetical protein